MYKTRWIIAALAVVGATARAWGEAPGGDAAKAPTKTKNVVLVMSDGLRWQEVFRGAEPSLISKKDGGVSDVEGVKRAYGRSTPEARREACPRGMVVTSPACRGWTEPGLPATWRTFSTELST